MGYKDVNVVVGSYNHDGTHPQTYKTVILKAGIPLGDQFTEENTIYVVKWDFEIGMNKIYSDLDLTTGGTMVIDGVTYYWSILVSGADNNTLNLCDNTVFFCELHSDVLIPDRSMTLNKDEAIRIASPLNTYHEKAYYTEANAVVIPENCVLKFEGGSLDNGNLVGNTTIIEANPVTIFGENLELDGSWNVSEAYPEWWGAAGDGEKNDTIPFRKALSVEWKIVATGEYVITDTIQVNNILDGNGKGIIKASIENPDSICIELSRKPAYDNAYLRNIKVTGNGTCYGVWCHRYAVMENCIVQSFNYGIAIVSYNISVLYCQSKANNINIGIASAHLDSPGYIEQTNAINIIGGDHTDAVSGINIKVGRTAWYEPGTHQYSFGTRLLISQCSLDGGAVHVEDYGNVVVSDCYLEHADRNGSPYNFYIGDGVNNLVITNNYISFNDYGIYSDSLTPPSLTIVGNRYTKIDKTCIYLLNTPKQIVYKNNIGHSNTQRAVHLGIHQDTLSDANYMCKMLLQEVLWEINNLYYQGQISPGATELGKIASNFMTLEQDTVITGHFVAEDQFYVDRNPNYFVPGMAIKEGSKCYITHVDYNERLIHIKSFGNLPDSMLTELTIPVFSVSTGIVRRNSNTEGLFNNLWKGAIVYDEYTGHLYYPSVINQRNIEHTNRIIVVIVEKKSDFSLVTSSTKLIEITNAIDLQGDTIDLSGTFLSIRFNGGKLLNGTIILDMTSIEGVEGDILNYITSSCTISGTFRTGQMLYDPELKLIKMWNGVKWVKTDGTDLPL